MDSITIDTSELRTLAADMRQVDSRVSRWVLPVVEKGANNIKEELQAEARSSRHFKGVAPAISYDIKTLGGAFEAEIGPEKRYGKGSGGGNHANIGYFGTSRGGGTVEDPQTALDNEAPKFADALADSAEGLVFG